MSQPPGPAWRLGILQTLIERVYRQLLECGPSTFAREQELHKLLIPLLREYRMTEKALREPGAGNQGEAVDESAPPPPEADEAPPQENPRRAIAPVHPIPHTRLDGCGRMSRTIPPAPAPPVSKGHPPFPASGLETAPHHRPDASARRVEAVTDQIMRESLQYQRRRHGKTRAP